MSVNRRGFLGFIGAAIAGATLDPEKLLWQPGKKLISVPAVQSFTDSSLIFYLNIMTQFSSPRTNMRIDNIKIPKEDWFRIDKNPIDYIELKDFLIG